MNNFTLEEIKPSEQTLRLIRQIAYTYRVVKHEGIESVYCLN